MKISILDPLWETGFASRHQVAAWVFHFCPSDLKIILCRAHFQDSIVLEFREQIAKIQPSVVTFFQIAFEIFSPLAGKFTPQPHHCSVSSNPKTSTSPLEQYNSWSTCGIPFPDLCISPASFCLHLKFPLKLTPQAYTKHHCRPYLAIVA